MDKNYSLNPEVPYEDFDWDAFVEDVAESVQEDTKPSAPPRQFIPENEIVEGVVTSISRREVIVDIGAKCEGAIAAFEFRYNPDLKVGDKVEVLVENAEDRKGQLVISHKKARQLKSWDMVNAAYDNNEVVKGYVKTRTKGGMIVDVFGIDAFLPGSQIDIKPIRDYDVFVDTTMDFKIVKINQEFRNVVVSHRAVIEPNLETERSRILSVMTRGQVLEGTVKSITDYGVFVDLGILDGFIHISDLSWGRISHPEEVVALDQKINVVVLDVSVAHKRIALGLKQLTPNPWDELEAKYPVGTVVDATVTAAGDKGYALKFEDGTEAAAFNREMVKEDGKQAVVGETLPVKVVELRRSTRTVRVSHLRTHTDGQSLPGKSPSPEIDPSTFFSAKALGLLHEKNDE